MFDRTADQSGMLTPCLIKAAIRSVPATGLSFGALVYKKFLPIGLPQLIALFLNGRSQLSRIGYFRIVNCPGDPFVAVIASPMRAGVLDAELSSQGYTKRPQLCSAQ